MFKYIRCGERTHSIRTCESHLSAMVPHRTKCRHHWPDDKFGRLVAQTEPAGNTHACSVCIYSSSRSRGFPDICFNVPIQARTSSEGNGCPRAGHTTLIKHQGGTGLAVIALAWEAAHWCRRCHSAMHFAYLFWRRCLLTLLKGNDSGPSLFVRSLLFVKLFL